MPSEVESAALGLALQSSALDNQRGVMNMTGEASPEHAAGTEGLLAASQLVVSGEGGSTGELWPSLAPRWAALGVATAVCALGVAGVAWATSQDPVLRPFDLDGEWNVPAIASSLLLLGAAASLVRLGFRLQPGIAAWLFSAMLVFAAVDEAAQIHETSSSRSTSTGSARSRAPSSRAASPEVPASPARIGRDRGT